MATSVAIPKALSIPSPEPMMRWEVQGQIMTMFSVVVFFGQIFQLIIASAVAKAANDGQHVEMENALKVAILVLIPSLVGRVVAGAAWSFGRVQSSAEKKGSRMVALFETLWGNVLLLVLSAVSTFTTAILLGAFSPKWSVLYESRNVDSTNNVKFLVGSSIALSIVCALEMLYSHAKYFTRSAEPSAQAYQANGMLINTLIFVLAVLMIGSLGVSTYFVVIVQATRKLTYVASYAAKGAILRDSLDRMFTAAVFGLVMNAVTTLLYGLKGCVTWVDRAPLARIIKLTCSSAAVFTAAATYGGTLPKLSYLGTYEPDGKAIYDSSNNQLFMVTSLAAVNFFVLFGAVSVAHILAFARTKL
jgi:hypothetical protein